MSDAQDKSLARRIEGARTILGAGVALAIGVGTAVAFMLTTYAKASDLRSLQQTVETVKADQRETTYKVINLEKGVLTLSNQLWEIALSTDARKLVPPPPDRNPDTPSPRKEHRR